MCTIIAADTQHCGWSTFDFTLDGQRPRVLRAVSWYLLPLLVRIASMFCCES
ncbi:hypothetical protein Leryth_004307 [Lithospermum erythrorhizon]|nr:hypothetical protein Leryth_004307 [Lithospermum erythrorhizon]